jgi:hypothetical protein
MGTVLDFPMGERRPSVRAALPAEGRPFAWLYGDPAVLGFVASEPALTVARRRARTARRPATWLRSCLRLARAALEGAAIAGAGWTLLRWLGCF